MTFKFVRESNYRGHVNERLARHLRLPYLPDVARLPSVLALDEYHAERAARAQRLGGDPFVLPVFLALALRGARKPEDVWSAIAELRPCDGVPAAPQGSR